LWSVGKGYGWRSQQVIERLLGAEASPDVGGGLPTPLQAAPYRGREDTVRRLLSAGARVDAGSAQLVEILLQSGAMAGPALVLQVIGRNNVRLMDLLLQHGAGTEAQWPYLAPGCCREETR
jgi:hypothetical protein